MKIVMEEYLPRLLDEKLDEYLKVFGALSVEGPKWCGKTWTSSKHAQSAVYFDDEDFDYFSEDEIMEVGGMK